MDEIAQQLKAYIDTHPFDSGDSDCKTVLDQLYQAYADLCSDIYRSSIIRNNLKESTSHLVNFRCEVLFR